MAVVKDYYIGNTRIRIHDDYCVKTQEEIDSILKRIGSIYADYLTRKLIEEGKKERKEKNG